MTTPTGSFSGFGINPPIQQREGEPNRSEEKKSDDTSATSNRDLQASDSSSDTTSVLSGRIATPNVANRIRPEDNLLTCRPFGLMVLAGFSTYISEEIQEYLQHEENTDNNREIIINQSAIHKHYIKLIFGDKYYFSNSNPCKTKLGKLTDLHRDIINALQREFKSIENYMVEANFQQLEIGGRKGLAKLRNELQDALQRSDTDSCTNSDLESSERAISIDISRNTYLYGFYLGITMDYIELPHDISYLMNHDVITGYVDVRDIGDLLNALNSGYEIADGGSEGGFSGSESHEFTSMDSPDGTSTPPRENAPDEHRRGSYQISDDTLFQTEMPERLNIEDDEYLMNLNGLIDNLRLDSFRGFVPITLTMEVRDRLNDENEGFMARYEIRRYGDLFGYDEADGDGIHDLFALPTGKAENFRDMLIGVKRGLIKHESPKEGKR